MKSIELLMLSVLLALCVSLSVGSEPRPDGFPFKLPRAKPDRELSAAMKRNYTAYSAPRPEHNELFSLFKYTELMALVVTTRYNVI